MSSQSRTLPVVAVTGGAGYIASELIKQLVAFGYRVRTTVRDVNNPAKVSHLKELFPTVQLFEADLLKSGTFDEICDGAEIVFHTASPFQNNVSDPIKDLIEPAVLGTENVLTSALKASSVKRIVLTSSIAAVRGARTADHIFTEADWNDTATIETSPYVVSKYRAEKKAWEMMAAAGRTNDLVTICPSFVLGPMLSTRVDGESVRGIASTIDGSTFETGYRAFRFPVVDVRDVAKAHIHAAFLPHASGRYIVSSEKPFPSNEIASFYKKHYPKLRISEKMNGTFILPEFFMSHAKAETELGITFTPVETTLKDMADALISLGIVKVPEN